MYDRLLIDGYSLLHRDPQLADCMRRDIQAARRLLTARLEALAGVRARRITVVFDGRGTRTEQDAGESIEVLYSPAHMSADTVIARMLSAGGKAARESVLLVSNDRAVLDHAAGCGAEVMSCGSFVDWCREDDERRHFRPKRNRGARLRDVFPDQAD